ncbi:hypothetical protein D1J35_10725 [Riemerella anatipestifer]|nr:hypothetical protein [Riemerella anatipestifer]
MLKYKKCKKYFKKITLEKFNGINGAEKRHFDRKFLLRVVKKTKKRKRSLKRTKGGGVMCSIIYI